MTNTVNNEIKNILTADLSWDKLKNKTVMITGATGFIGSYIVRALLERSRKDNLGIKILAVVMDPENAEGMFADYIADGSFEYIAGNVCDPVKTDKKAQYIIHCASNAAPKEYSMYPVETMKTNFHGTLNMLDYAKAVESEGFLYVSTIEVYGTTHGIDKIAENIYGEIDALQVRSCYPLSKKACETLCVSYSDEYGVPVKIGRLSYIFGPGMRPGDSKIVAVFPQCIADNENIVMKSKGEQIRSYTYIADAITGLLTVLLDGEKGQAYNIASKLCITSIAGIAETLVKSYPEKGLKVIFDIPTSAERKGFSLIENAVMDSSKLENLGWQPTVDLVTGLKRVVEDRIELKGE